MTVAFRASSQVVNGTAGTSVVVPTPASVGAGDFLLAFIAEVGAGSITAPAGWTLIGSQAAGTSVTIAAYYKTAASEGASWTWTLGASARAWGWVGAYAGVDPTSPFVEFNSYAITTPGTASSTPQLFIQLGGIGVEAVAGVRTAAGTATTWTIVPDAANSVLELADLSTNGGTGTDIAGLVGGTDWFEVSEFFGSTATASQTQSAMAMWAMFLRPAFVSYPDGIIPAIVKAAYGADPDSDPATWTWTDISVDVRADPGVRVRKGRADETSRPQPTEVTLSVLNLAGQHTPGNPMGAHYPNIVRNLPLQVSVPHGFSPLGTERATVFVDSLSPRWDEQNRPIVDIVASGRTRRMQQGAEPLHSAIYRTLLGAGPVAYWPGEDGSGSTQLGSALAGAPAMNASNLNFAADDSMGGSAALPTMDTFGANYGLVPAYPNAGNCLVVFYTKMPTPVTVEAAVLRVETTGSAAIYQVSVSPGTPNSMTLRVYDRAGVQILANSTALPSDAAVYGRWVMIHLYLEQVGSTLECEAGWDSVDAGGGGGGGTLVGYTHGIAVNVSTLASAELAGTAIGHFAVFSTPGFDPDNDIVPLTLPIDGHAGEDPAIRFSRLCQEEGVPFDIVRDAGSGWASRDLEVGMGPQPIATLLDALDETEQVDGGVIHDGGPGGELIFVTRPFHYNASPALVLDHALGQLAPGFQPEYDDQRIRNDVTISRKDGSSARYADDESVQAEGRYREDITLNLLDDSRLSDLASWRAHLGTVEELRYPSLRFNLRQSPELVRRWLATRVGSQVQATNLMEGHPPGPVAQIIEGYTETFTGDRWEVELFCSPASPYTVGVWDQDRADTSGSELAAAITGSAVSFDVAVTAGPMWTTDDAQFPLTATAAGEDWTVTDVAASLITFVAAGTVTHAVNAGVTPGLPAGIQAGDLLLIWCAIRNSGAGTPTAPAGWTTLLDSGNAKLFGKIAGASESAPFVTFAGSVANADTSAQMVAFRGKFHNAGEVVCRWTDALNASGQDIPYPGMAMEVANALVLYLGWKQDDWTSVASPGTEIGEPDTTTGDDQGLVWAYTIQTTPTNIATGSFVVSGGASAISRGAVVAIRADKQTWTVTRGANGVTKSHAAGTSVRLKTPARVAL